MRIFGQQNQNIQINPSDLDIPQPGAPNNTDVESILSYTFAILAGIAIIVIVVAGMRFVLSQGNSEKANSARNTIIYAAIGLALAAGSFAIVRFVVGQF